MSHDPAFESFRALGCPVVVGAGDPRRRAGVVATVREEVEACDLACSRFRPDSELSRLNERRDRRAVPASPWLLDALSTALGAAEDSDGLVDPTIGQCLVDLGYDRTFDDLRPDTTLVVHARHVPAWRQITVDRASRTVTVPGGVRLDLGATAKARCADRAAERAAAAHGTGVLVSLGGDIAVAGAAPRGGWVVRVTDRSDADPLTDRRGQTVVVSAGGLATSGTAARRWSRHGETCHHLVDPRSGRPAEEVWRTVSVAAASCVAANTASTTAVIVGAGAPGWLATRGLDARLVAPDGAVVTVGRWPSEAEVAA